MSLPAGIETREVLAGAYVTGLKTRLLSHAVRVDANRFEVGVLCNRVRLGNLADRGAGDPQAEPTCRDCLQKLRVLRKAQP